MKITSLVAAIAVFALAAPAAESAPAFNAVLSIGKDHRFVLVDESGKSSKWLQVGESFDGYTIKSYEPATGLLAVSRDGKDLKLTLVSGAAIGMASTPGLATPVTPATLADAEEVFRVMRFDEMMSKILEQQKKALNPMLQQMTGKMPAEPEEKEAIAAFQKKVSDEMMNAMLGPEMRADMAKIYSEVFSKEELNGLASFYTTSAGQALVDKQPDVQQKMMAAMMPRMAVVMPKIQQMGKEFAAERAAKRAAAAAPSASPPVKP